MIDPKRRKSYCNILNIDIVDIAQGYNSLRMRIAQWVAVVSRFGMLC